MSQNSRVMKLFGQGLIKPPDHVVKGMQYETIMGSAAYGVSDNVSDIDVYGFNIPFKTILFPHLDGYIDGFGSRPQNFGQWEQHHVKSQDGNKVYDLTIFNIVKYFQLCMGCNPNMIDSLFTHESQVLFMTKIGQLVRERRRLFLSKKAWHTYKGYAYQQHHKLANKKPESGKRKELIDRHGYDTKFAYHIVRLLCQVEQILEEGDLDLMGNREQLKAIRRGEWTEAQISEYYQKKVVSLETLKIKSDLQDKPDESAIKELLFNCLEEHFGSLKNVVVMPDRGRQFTRKLRDLIEEYSDVTY